MKQSKYASQMWTFAVLWQDGTRTFETIRAKYQSRAFSRIETMFQYEMGLIVEIGLIGVST
jgi:hypothetical protein